MIKFFRHIRQSLLSENKFSKYLLYAIGEIILVVIGILIALKINNWNEQQKLNRLEQRYYCKLLEDVNQDVIQIAKHLSENEDRLSSGNMLLHLLQQENPDRVEVIRHLQGATSKTTYTFKPSLAAFDDLKSSGNLIILRDLSIKDKLINYYSTLEGYIDIIDVNSDKTVALYFDSTKDFVEFGFQNIEFVKNEIDTALVDIDALNASPYPSAALRKQLLSDGVFYMTTNARKKLIYKLMEEEIINMQRTMSKKCE
ncbi:MAG TPA: DUF6090 family protein [Saprospiraceae bacterium]|nr:DUF6090 family protein [Saprospiraceae bacterium]